MVMHVCGWLDVCMNEVDSRMVVYVVDWQYGSMCTLLTDGIVVHVRGWFKNLVFDNLFFSQKLNFKFLEEDESKCHHKKLDLLTFSLSVEPQFFKQMLCKNISSGNSKNLMFAQEFYFNTFNAKVFLFSLPPVLDKTKIGNNAPRSLVFHILNSTHVGHMRITMEATTFRPISDLLPIVKWRNTQPKPLISWKASCSDN